MVAAIKTIKHTFEFCRKRRRRSDKFEEREENLTEKSIDCRNARRSPVEKVSRDLVEKMQV